MGGSGARLGAHAPPLSGRGDGHAHPDADIKALECAGLEGGFGCGAGLSRHLAGFALARSCRHLGRCERREVGGRLGTGTSELDAHEGALNKKKPEREGDHAGNEHGARAAVIAAPHGPTTEDSARA